MKRKILALVLAATMIGSLTACGSGTTDGGSAAKSSAKRPEALQQVLQGNITNSATPVWMEPIHSL